MIIGRNNKTAGVIVLMAALLGGPVAAIPHVQETSPPATSDKLNRDYLKQVGRDFIAVVSSPAQWTGSDWLTFAALTGAGLTLFAFDRPVYEWVQDHKTQSSIDASPVINKLGNGGFLLGLSTVLYVSGEAFDSRSLRKTALLSLESFLTTTAFVLTLKSLAGRARPNTGESPGSFHPLSFSTGHTSLPSGDAAGAFAVATTIAEETESLAVDILAYGLAGLAAVYRVHDRKHWPSDVLVGSALGFLVGKKISALHRGSAAENYHVSLELSSRRQSITLSFAF